MPMLNLDFLLNQVMKSSVPHYFAGVLEFLVPFKVLLTSLDANRSVQHNKFRSTRDLRMCLWFSA